MKHTSTISRVIYFFPTIFLYSIGFISYQITGKTPKISYKSFRFLHVITNGWINEFSNKLISLKRKPKTKDTPTTKSILGEFSDKKINDILTSLNKDGYYIFEKKLSEPIINDILEFGSTTPTKKMESLGKYQEKEVVVNENYKAESPRYQFKNERLFTNSNLTKIIFDDLFLKISEKYLKCRPIFDYFVMWWSFPFKGKLTNEAAQKYHFDMDRIKFIKFFFYVTDVDTNNGPHCFVRGTHKDKPSPLRKDGRIEDEEIAEHCPKEDILEICGKKGTVMIVDTIGFHKGKSLTEGSRLLFQILYSNSLFGVDNAKIDLPKEVYNENSEFLDQNRDVYNQTLTY